MTAKEFTEGIVELESTLTRLRERLNVPEKNNELSRLMEKLSSPDVWKNAPEAEHLSKEAGRLENILSELKQAENSISSLSSSSGDDAFYAARRLLRDLETEICFTGKYDSGNAVLFIHSGAGGEDAADWAGMLLEMYLKYAARRSWRTRLIDESLSDFQSKTGRKPLKNAAVEISGDYAYGYLKGESGVHRLVRISPFSPKKLRHTSFALVEILPVLPEVDANSISIPEDDLKVDLFRSSGPGGQNVNKVETAVRLTHLPTGLTVASQAERSQSQNRARALSLLKSKLFHLMTANQVKELSALKSKLKPEWGSQIRSYVLHPYHLVKDHRTDTETSRVDDILEGDLDEFIDAELLNQNK